MKRLIDIFSSVPIQQKIFLLGIFSIHKFCINDFFKCLLSELFFRVNTKIREQRI